MVSIGGKRAAAVGVGCASTRAVSCSPFHGRLQVFSLHRTQVTSEASTFASTTLLRATAVATTRMAICSTPLKFMECTATRTTPLCESGMTAFRFNQVAPRLIRPHLPSHVLILIQLLRRLSLDKLRLLLRAVGQAQLHRHQSHLQALRCSATLRALWWRCQPAVHAPDASLFGQQWRQPRWCKWLWPVARVVRGAC